jgi:hypothetical protein
MCRGHVLRRVAVRVLHVCDFVTLSLSLHLLPSERDAEFQTAIRRAQHTSAKARDDDAFSRAMTADVVERYTRARAAFRRQCEEREARCRWLVLRIGDCYLCDGKATRAEVVYHRYLNACVACSDVVGGLYQRARAVAVPRCAVFCAVLALCCACVCAVLAFVPCLVFAVLCCAVLCCAVLCCAVLCCAVLCCACAVLCLRLCCAWC